MKFTYLIAACVAATVVSGCSSTKEMPPSGTSTSGYESRLSNPLSTKVVYFELDKDIVRQDYLPVVAAHAREAASRGASIRLEGHADELGSREYNVGLGDRRANAVKRLMASYGMPVAKLKTVSYGEERPMVVSGGSQEKNRRVEIKY